jgi:hypothetical protein
MNLNCGHQQVYFSSPRNFFEYREAQWNDADREKPKNTEKNQRTQRETCLCSEASD